MKNSIIKKSILALQLFALAVMANAANCPGGLSVSISASTPACTSVSLTATGSGGGPGTTYSYNWSSGNSTGTALNTFTAVGTYTVSVTVTDDSACTATKTASVTVYANPPSPTITSPTSDCSPVTLTASATGATGYAWSGGNNPTSAADNVTRSGTYTVTVTNANNCSASATVAATVSLTPSALITPGGDTSFCAGGSVLLAAPSTGNAITFGGGLVTASSAYSIGTGAFTVEAWIYPTSSGAGTIVAQQGSGAAFNFVVNANGAGSLGLIINGVDTLQTSGGLLQNRWQHVAVSVNGGTSGNQTMLYIDGLAVDSVNVAGTTLSLTTLNIGKSFTGSIDEVRIWDVALTQTDIQSSMYSIVPSNSPNLVNYYRFDDTTGTTVVDLAGTATGTLSGTYNRQIPSTSPVGENTGATFLYNWSTGSVSQAIDVSAAGSYSVIVTNSANNCSAGSTYTVTQSANPVPTIDSVGPICAGSTLSLTATATGTNTYAWSGPNNFTSSVYNPTINNVSTAAYGEYSVTVTNSNNCSASVSSLITINAGPVAKDSTILGCVGSTVYLSSGQTSDVSYSWSGPGGYTSSAQTPSVVHSSTGTYVYTVNITNYNGCSAVDSITVVISNAYPSPYASSTGTVCAGLTVSLTSGPSGETSYAWSGPGGYTSSAQSPTITNSTAAESGTYTVTVDSNGCSSTATVTVSIDAPPAFASSNSPVCTGSILSLTSGPSNETSYSWSGPGFTSSAQDTSLSTIANGTYYVTITDASGCSATASTQVTTSGAPPVDTAGNTGPVCAGSTLYLSSSAATSYVWSGPGGFSSTSQTPSLLNTPATASGTYTVTVTAANGCTATASTNVIVDSLPDATATNSTDSTQCAGENIYLYSGGGVSYAWSGPLGFAPTQQNDTIIAANAAATGTYTVIVTDANGCSATASTSLVVIDVPAVAVAGLTDTVCTGEALELSADGGISYTWSGPNGFISDQQDTTIQQVTQAATGIYTVVATNAGGCSATASTNVTVNVKPVITSCPGNMIVNETPGLCSAVVNFAVIATGVPNPGIWYSQNPGTVFPLGTTNILANAFNTCGSATCTFTITVVDNQPPVFACPSNIAQLATEATDSLILSIPVPSVTDNCGVASLVNSFNGTDNASGTYPAGTTYVVWTATDVNGNTSTCTQTITIYPNLVLSGTATNSLCPGTFFGTVSTLVAGGQSPYTYAWSNGSTSANLSNLAAGNYTLTVTDAANNTVSETFTVSTVIPTTAPAAPGVITGPAYVCANATATYSIAAVPNTVSYSWTVPNGATILSGQGTTQITVKFPSASSCGNIQVAAVNCVGSSNCGNGQLNVNLIAVPSRPGSIQGSAYVCAAGAVYQYSVPPASNSNYPVTYTWTVPTNASIVSGQGTNAVSVKFATGYTTGSLSVYASDCAGNSSAVSLTIAVSTHAPSAMSDIDVYSTNGDVEPSGVCAGDTISYTVLNDVPAQYVATYNWTAPAHSVIIAGQGTQVVTVVFLVGYNGGNLSVYGSNCIGNGTAATQSIPLNTQVPGNPCTPFCCNSGISGQNTACPGDTVTYSINAISNALSYTWTVPAYTTLISGQGTTTIRLVVQAAFSGGNLSVYASNCAGNSAPSVLYTDIANPPGTPCSLNGPSAVCTGFVYNYTCGVASGEVDSYVWTVPANATIISGQGTTSVFVSYQSGFTNGTVSVSAANCIVNSNPNTMSVYAQTQVPSCPSSCIYGTSNVCIGDTEVYTAQWSNGATNYTWTSPANTVIISGQGSTTISVQFNTGYTGGNLSVVASNCIGSATASTFRLTHINCGIHDATAIDDNTISQFNVQAYPNPFNGQFYLKITGDNNEPANMKIYDITGKIVDESNNVPYEQEISVGSKLESGVYLVEVKQGDNTKVLRIVKAE